MPEGFYSVSQQAMNPNSSFYLSFNIGYPNAVDRQLGRTGNHIMVHGDCSSMGCFAMTDGQIADIYALTREAFAGGQTSIQLQSFPFRMTPENLARYRNDPNIGFWRTLKQGNDYFEVSREPVKTAACSGRYAFGSTECGGGKANPEISTAVAAKMQRDELRVAELSKTVRPIKRLYRDGDMHPMFKPTQVADGSKPVGTTRNGVSRPDALAFTPVDVPVEQYRTMKAKGRSYAQMAELFQQEQLNEQMAGQAGGTAAEPAKPAAAPVAAPAATPRPGQPPRPATSVAAAPAQAQPAAASQAAALAPAQAEPPQRSMFQRVLSGVGLGGGDDAKPADVKVEEVTPHRVNVPLPPRRQAATTSTPGPQAATPAAPGRVSELIAGPERLAPASAASGFSKLQ